MLVLDIGAKFGIHPNFRDLKDLYNFILVDADPEEAKDLKQLYKKKNNIKILNYFFDNKYSPKVTKMNLYSHSGKHSFYEIKGEKIKKKINVKTSFIDAIKQKISFLKIDVEGKELDCLLGGNDQLRKNILGVRCEVLLNPLYKNQGETWSKVNDHLNSLGFDFMNFDLIKNVSFNTYIKYELNYATGKIIAVDGVWVKKISIILKSRCYKQIIDYVIFCINNNLTDLAIKILKNKSSLIREKIVNDKTYKKLFSYIEFKLARNFFYQVKIKSFKKNIISDYKKIFNKNWPIEGKFFKFYPLNKKY
jgi:FkbM family methyltransferase